MENNIAIIVADDSSYYFGHIKSCSVISVLGKSKKTWLRFCKYVPSLVERRILKKVGSQRFELIIIFDTALRYLPTLPYLLKDKCSRLVLYSWNMITRDFESYCNRFSAFSEKYSFSQSDCCIYGFSYIPLMVEPISDASRITYPDTDFFFLGYEKNRLDRIKSIYALVCDFNSIFFIIGNGARYDGGGMNYLKRPMAYSEYIARLKNTRCVIDIPVAKQDGYTLRIAEAVVYGKKIITTNSFIKNEPFYNENMIYVIDEKTTSEDIKRFIKTPDIDYECGGVFLFENWLKSIVEGGNEKN